MKTKAVRLYGEMDLRLEEFDLPEIREDEILAKVISDSICMSSYKAAKQGKNHKRIPDDIAENPVIIGHEFCGELIQIGEKWKNKFMVGDKFVIQPALNYNGSLYSPGYSYKYIGGAATYIIIPREVMELGCLLPYHGDGFFYGSLAEPMSCIVGGFHANYHTTPGSYVHKMECVRRGKTAILAGAGPMGMGAVDYAVHCDNPPSLLVVTDIDGARLDRAESLLTPGEAEKYGVKLVYVNTKPLDDPAEYLLELSRRAGSADEGYDDVFVYAPVKSVIEMGDKILSRDGCLNFFAGPTDSQFSAEFNFYNVHYSSTHVVGTSGGNTADMLESIAMMEQKKLDPASMITHVGGLDSAAETTLHLPEIKGAKKLIYTNISFPLTELDSLGELAKTAGKYQPVYADLAEIVALNNGLWSTEAEKYLLSRADTI